MIWLRRLAILLGSLVALLGLALYLGLRGHYPFYPAQCATSSPWRPTRAQRSRRDQQSFFGV